MIWSSLDLPPHTHLEVCFTNPTDISYFSQAIDQNYQNHLYLKLWDGSIFKVIALQA